MYPTVKTFPTRDIEQLCPAVKAMVIKFLAECKKRGIQVFVTQTYRSREYQAELHKKLGAGASPPGLSMHEYRCAFDLATSTKGNLYHVPTLEAAGAVWKGMGGTWGGDFKNIDRPHFQYTGKYTQEQIRAGKIPA